MEVNTTIIVTILVIIIIILIFSKISIGMSNDESTVIDQKIKAMENKITSGSSNNQNTKSPFNPRTNDLLSTEFKKQLDEIQSKFYYDNCRVNKF
jgi:hypothetical protein